MQLKAEISTAQDKEQIYQLWKKVFYFDDNGSIDYYFSNYFEPKNCYIIKEQNKIISTLCANPHKIVLDSKVIDTSMICGVLTEEKYQRQGLMRELLNFTLKELKKRELLTLIQAYNPNIYTPFGFYMWYQKKIISLHEKSPERSFGCKITQSINIGDLVVVYKQFTKDFNGYYLRDENYYKKYIGDLNAQNIKYIGAVDESKNLLGYMFYKTEEETILIEEFIYIRKDKNILYTFLKELFKIKENVILNLSNSEDIANNISKKEQVVGNTMVKIHDHEAFCKKLNKDPEAFGPTMNFSKPMYINEYW